MTRAGPSQERGGAGIKDRLWEICRPAIDPLGQLSNDTYLFTGTLDL